MVRYLGHKEIDKKKWDESIASSFNCRIYAMSFYLDIVSPGWEALVQDDYKAVMPLTWRRKYGISYLFQPYFTQQLGIFSKEETAEKLLADFFSSIPSKFSFIEICINSENTEVFPKKSNSKSEYILKKNSNYELDLKKPYNDIYSGYSENTRRNIKKAVKAEVKIKASGVEVQDLIQLFKKNKGKDFPHLKRDYYHILKKVETICSTKKLVKILGAYNRNDDLLAGAVFLIFKGRAIFLFSATNEEAKSKRAMFGLLDFFISQHAGSLSILDFEGSNNADLARFYKSFGAKEFVFLQIKKNKLPKYIQWLKR